MPDRTLVRFLRLVEWRAHETGLQRLRTAVVSSASAVIGFHAVSGSVSRLGYRSTCPVAGEPLSNESRKHAVEFCVVSASTIAWLPLRRRINNEEPGKLIEPGYCFSVV